MIYVLHKGNIVKLNMSTNIDNINDENISGREKFGLVFKEGRIGFINGSKYENIANLLPI